MIHTPSAGFSPSVILSEFLTNSHWSGPAPWRTQWELYPTGPGRFADAVVGTEGGTITLGLSPIYFGNPAGINNSFVQMLRGALPTAFAPAALYIDQGATLIHELGHIFNARSDMGGSSIRGDAGNSIQSGNNQSIVYNNCVRPIFPMIPVQNEDLRLIVGPITLP